MGYIEEIERAAGRHYRAVPWLAGPPGTRGKRGPTNTYGPGEYHLAEKWIISHERTDDAEWRDAGAPVQRQRARVRFADYVVTVAADLGEAWATRQSYASVARVLARRWPEEYIHELTAADLNGYMTAMLDEPISAGLRARRRLILAATFAAATRDGYLDEDPAADLRRVQQLKVPRRRPISEAEIGRVLAALPPWAHAGVWLSYDSALRIGEVFGLPWRNVDLDTGVITVGPVMQSNGRIKAVPKNRTVQSVVASARALDALRAHAERYPGKATDLVVRRFTSNHNRRPAARAALAAVPVEPRAMSTDAGASMWSLACRDAALADPMPRWHDMRHHAAKALVEAGTPVHVLKAMMRHHNIASTAVYMPDVTPAQMRDALARVGPETEERRPA